MAYVSLTNDELRQCVQGLSLHRTRARTRSQSRAGDPGSDESLKKLFAFLFNAGGHTNEFVRRVMGIDGAVQAVVQCLASAKTPDTLERAASIILLLVRCGFNPVTYVTVPELVPTVAHTLVQLPRSHVRARYDLLECVAVCAKHQGKVLSAQPGLVDSLIGLFQTAKSVDDFVGMQDSMRALNGCMQTFNPALVSFAIQQIMDPTSLDKVRRLAIDGLRNSCHPLEQDLNAATKIIISTPVLPVLASIVLSDIRETACAAVAFFRDLSVFNDHDTYQAIIDANTIPAVTDFFVNKLNSVPDDFIDAALACLTNIASNNDTTCDLVLKTPLLVEALGQVLVPRLNKSYVAEAIMLMQVLTERSPLRAVEAGMLPCLANLLTCTGCENPVILSRLLEMLSAIATKHKLTTHEKRFFKEALRTYDVFGLPPFIARQRDAILDSHVLD